jgi:hypothetical protein
MARVCKRMGLRSKIRREWRDLKDGRPGHRFRDRYDRDAGRHEHVGWRVVKILAGITALLVGVVEIIFPGPAILFLFVGGALLATQSRAIARLMDWAELRIRAVWRFVRRRWRSTSHGARAALVSLLVCGGAASGYLMYRVVLD